MRRAVLVLLTLVACVAAGAAQDAPAEKPLQRIAFGSCSRHDKPQPLWKPIIESKPDLWIWLGDIVYAKRDDIADLTRRYAAEKQQPEYVQLRQQCRVLGVWDDSDFAVSGGNKNAQKAESQRLLLDFLDEPAESARRQQAGVNASYTFGPPGRQVKIILLDERFHRAAADILGADQWAWLEQQLTGSTADVHVIGSGIQIIAREHRYEKWADFPGNRERLIDLLAKTGARNPILLSGDRHLGEISRLTGPRFAQPLYDITSSGMTHHAEDHWFRNFSNEPNAFRCGRNYLDFNFGVVEFDWDASPAIAKLQIRGADGAVHIEEKLTLEPAAATER